MRNLPSKFKQQGFLLNPYRFGNGGDGSDPYFDDVVYLTHANGADGSITLIDSGPIGYSMTAVGSAHLEDTQKKFGTTSIQLVSPNDYFTRGTSIPGLAFGTNDFTIEFFAYKSSNGASGYDIALTTDTSNGSAVNGWFIELSTNRGFVMSHNGGVIIAYAMNPNTSVMTHYAVTRNGSTFRLFVGGVLVASTTATPNILANGNFGIGGSISVTTYRFNGYLDEIRITKNVARYTTTFTPPSAEFPGAT